MAPRRERRPRRRHVGAGGDPGRVVHVEREPAAHRLEALVQVEVVLEGGVRAVRVERRRLSRLVVQDEEPAPLRHGPGGLGPELLDVLERVLDRVAVGAQLAAEREVLDEPVHGVEARLGVGRVGDLDGRLVAGGRVPREGERLQLLDDEGRDLPLVLDLADPLEVGRRDREVREPVVARVRPEVPRLVGGGAREEDVRVGREVAHPRVAVGDELRALEERLAVAPLVPAEAGVGEEEEGVGLLPPGLAALLSGVAGGGLDERRDLLHVLGRSLADGAPEVGVVEGLLRRGEAVAHHELGDEARREAVAVAPVEPGEPAQAADRPLALGVEPALGAEAAEEGGERRDRPLREEPVEVLADGEAEGDDRHLRAGEIVGEGVDHRRVHPGDRLHLLRGEAGQLAGEERERRRHLDVCRPSASASRSPPAPDRWTSRDRRAAGCRRSSPRSRGAR